MSSPSIKQVFHRMNQEVDVRSLKPGEYRKLINGIPIQAKNSTNPVSDAITSLFGNALIANADLAGGTNKIIGGCEDRAGNRYFFFIWNNTPANNTIYQFKDGVITRVMRTDLFGFSSTDYVSADVMGDILEFTNNQSDIKKLDILKAIAGATYTPLDYEITLIKRPPQNPVTLALGYDEAVNSNNLAGNYFQFFQRYIYENNDVSIFGPASRISNSWTKPNTAHSYDVVAAEGKANIALTGSPKTIDGRSCIVGDTVLLINQTNPVENGLWVVAAGAWARSTNLPAGSTYLNYLTAYATGGIIDFFDTVWRLTGFPLVGTDPIYFTQIEGPNFLTVTQGETTPAIVIRREFGVRINGANEIIVYRTEDKGAYSASHTFYNDSYLFTVSDAEATTWNDSVPLKSRALKFANNRTFLFNNTEGYLHQTTGQVTLTASLITPTATRTYQSAKPGGTYSVGVVFFDQFRRHSGVKCISTIKIPDDATASYKINVGFGGISADVPSWAVYMSIVMTKCQNASFFIKNVTVDIYHFKVKADGTYQYGKDITTLGATGTAIDISCLTKQNQGYTFNLGDRIKIYSARALSQVIIDTPILSQNGRFIITRVLNELALSTSLTENYFFEIYTPKENVQEPFFETGWTFPTFLGTAYDIDGDVENTNRVFYRDTTAYSATDPYANEYVPSITATVRTHCMNAWIKNYGVWVRQLGPGRSMIKGQSLQILKKGYLRWGDPYIVNSQIFGLNTFGALNEQALAMENGAGIGLALAGQVLVAIHEVESAAVYVNQGYIKTSDQNSFLTQTDKVVGDVQKYLGGHGSIDQATIVEHEGVVYWLDRRKGCFVRRAQDGLTNISALYGMGGFVGFLCNLHDTLGANSQIISGWDPQYECYVTTFNDLTPGTCYTLYWHEKSNGWVCMPQFYSEFLGQLGQKQLAFKTGNLWSQTIDANYNKFFGVQYIRTVEWEISTRSLEAIWEAIEVDVETIYATAGTNEVIVSLYHVKGGIVQNQINYVDFKLRGSAWRSSFFRNMNDVAYGDVYSSKYKSSHNTRGQSAFLSITYNGTDANPMKSISVFFRPSLNTSQ